MEQLCLDLSTEELAAQDKCKPQTIRKRLCVTGSYWGVVPKKHPSGRLLWPHDAAARVLSYKACGTRPADPMPAPGVLLHKVPRRAVTETVHLSDDHRIVIDALRRYPVTLSDLERATSVTDAAAIIAGLRALGMQVPGQDDNTGAVSGEPARVLYSLTQHDIRLAARLLKKGGKRG